MISIHFTFKRKLMVGNAKIEKIFHDERNYITLNSGKNVYYSHIVTFRYNGDVENTCSCNNEGEVLNYLKEQGIKEVEVIYNPYR
jgi:hypothetical protein